MLRPSGFRETSVDGAAPIPDADIARVILSPERIQVRVRQLAQEIAEVYTGQPPALTLVPILSGSIIFLADLIRELPLKMKIAVVHVSTYPGRSLQPGQPQLLMDVCGQIEGRDVLIVDDILDSGRTLGLVQAALHARRPASVRTAVLLRKRGREPRAANVDFIGFDIDDQFVVGYGLDFDDHYRNYPYIGVLRTEVTS
jgi:hypoxanthine phosphoribosyltransferase